MNRTPFANHLCASWFRKGASSILAFSWVLGLVLGFFLFYAESDFTSSLMVGCIRAPFSIVSLMLAYILPFLCSALAVFLSSPWLLPVICFGKAMLFSFVFSGLSFAWGTSAVFVNRFVLACNGICTPFLYCWWLRYISGERRASLLNFGLFMLPSLVIPVMVFTWVTPFWADVMIL